MTRRAKSGLSLMLTSVLCMIGFAAMSQGIQDGSKNPGEPEKIGIASVAEREFLTKAAQANMAEIRLGQLAEERGSSYRVRQFGKQMAKDHTSLGRKIHGLMKERRVDQPKDMYWKDSDNCKRLSDLSGAEFDRAWIRCVEEMHSKDIKLYQEAADNSRDSDKGVKQFATQRLPTLRSHLRKVREIARS